MVMSAPTAQLVQRHFILEKLESERLKGVDEPMHLARVIGRRERGHGTEEPMVGGFESLPSAG
jgi:class 3 adenylate cyclase